MNAIGPGDFVQCINTQPSRVSGKPCPLAHGGIYQISVVYRKGEIDPRDGLPWPGDCADLVGIPHWSHPFSAFGLDRFRPIPRSSEILGLLEKLKTGAPITEPVE